ncbi:MAG: hypothetical protein O9301_10190 [Leptospira sp.]|nr:hypothetical protein [Leptospira sp.]
MKPRKVISVLFVLYFFCKCGVPFSPRSNCYEKNKCSTIEGQCFLQNGAYYRLGSGTGDISSIDFTILAGTCLGLEATCRKNCESGTLF